MNYVRIWSPLAAFSVINGVIAGELVERTGMSALFVVIPLVIAGGVSGGVLAAIIEDYLK